MIDEPLVLLILAAAGVGVLVMTGGPLARQVAAFLVGRTRTHFQDMLIVYPPERAVAIAFGVTVAVGLLIACTAGMLLPGVLLLLVVPCLAELGFRTAKNKRRDQLDLQLPDTLMTVANSMRSGLTLIQAMEMSRDNSFPPISKELGIVLSENRLGTALEVSLEKMARRIESRYLDSAVSAIAITRRTGGNVAEGLEQIATTIRDIMRIENQIRAMTSQGKMEGIVMGIMPFVAIIGFYCFDKEMIMPLFTDPIGHCILVTIGFCDLIAIVVIRKVMAIDV